MKAAFLTASASRKAGGLFWSVRAAASHLRMLDWDLQVFAAVDEYTKTDRAAWQGIPLHLFPTRGPEAFGWMPGLAGALSEAQPDLVHTHGIWMYPSLAACSWGTAHRKPWMVSPRGMLDPWAIRRSAWKKRLAGRLYENRHLRGASCLQALCPAEAEAFRECGLRNPIAIIPNGVDLPDPVSQPDPPSWAHLVPSGSRTLLFLGRLHPKKGLVPLLHAWSCQPQRRSEPWILVIAGWDQGGHRAELERLAASLGISGSVRFVGPQFGTEKIAALRFVDAFVLPSFSEGLPMAVLEAWSYGLPVLMTPHCHLPEGSAAGAALEAEPEAGSLIHALDSLCRMDPGDRRRMGERGRALVASRFTWTEVARHLSDVYRWVLGRGDRPASVMQ